MNKMNINERCNPKNEETENNHFDKKKKANEKDFKMHFVCSQSSVFQPN